MWNGVYIGLSQRNPTASFLRKIGRPVYNIGRPILPWQMPLYQLSVDRFIYIGRPILYLTYCHDPQTGLAGSRQEKRRKQTTAGLGDDFFFEITTMRNHGYFFLKCKHAEAFHNPNKTIFKRHGWVLVSDSSVRRDETRKGCSNHTTPGIAR